MIAGQLEIQLMADMSRLAQDMQNAKRMTGDAMGAMEASMAGIKTSIDAMAKAEQARASLFLRTMSETKRLLGIAKGAADETAQSLAGLKLDPDALAVPSDALQSLKTWREQLAYAAGAGTAIAVDKAKTLWQDFKDFTERTVVIWGVALATGIAAAVLSAVYAAYKAISFGIGLLTGESYKSANIDALVAMNKEVKTLQESLPLTAVGASALNEALKAQGLTADSYAATLGKVESASRSNGDELDRLGVKYKNQNGSLLSTEERLKNAATVLATYKEGWDRTQAAQAIGMGTEKQIQDALAVTAKKTQVAKDRLVAYGLIIGEGTQEAVKKYEESMRAFERESDLTSQGFKRAIADNIMPVLTDLADFFREGFPTAVMAFRYSMATITSLFYGLKTIVFMVSESILGSISAIGLALGGVASAAWKAMKGDFSGAKDALVQGWEDAKGRLGGIGDNIIEQARRNSAAMALAWGADSLGANAAADSIKKVGKAWKDKEKDEKEAAESAYQKLMKDIGGKIAIQELELKGVENLTEGQKLAAKVMESLRDDTFKLTEEEKKHEVELKRALAIGLEKLIADERANDIRKLTIKAIEELAAAGAKEVKSAHELLEKQKEQNAEIGLSKEQIADLVARKIDLEAASDRELAANMRSAAQYAGPLHDAYLQYASDLENAANAKNELANIKRTGAQSQADFDSWKSLFDSIDRTAHDTFISIFDSGKSAFDRLRDALKNGLLDLLYQMTIKKWIFSIGAAVSGVPGIANSASGAGDAFGMANNGMSLYNAGSKVAGWLGMGGGTSATAAASIEAAELGSVMGSTVGVEAALAPAVEGGVLAGIQSAVASIPVWGWALAGAALLAKSLDHSGTYHTGSASTSSAAGTQAIDPRSLGFMQTVISADSQKMTDGIASSVANILNSTATTFGKSAGYSAATAFADDTSKDGAWGALLINKMGDKLIDWDSNRQSRWAPREFADGAAGQQQYIAALSASVRTALDSIGLPSWAQKMLDSLGSTPTIEALSSVVDNINATQQALVIMGNALAGFAALSDGAISALIAASGGIQALAGNANTYYENFYTDAEKAANTTKQVTEALSKFGIAMPATREEFRAQVEAQMALGEAGAPAVAALLKVSGAIAALIPVANDASTSLKDSLKAALSTAFSGLQKAVDAERTKLTKAYDDSLSTITKRIDKLRSLSDALNSSLGSRSTPGQFGADYAQAQAQIMAAAVIARAGGVLPDASSLQKALATVAQPTEQLFATFTDYQRDFLKTSNSIKDLADITDGQLSVEDRSLKVLEDSYKGGMSRLDSIIAATGKVDESVLSLPAAIAAYNAASKAAGGSAISDPAGVSANTGAGVASYDYVQAAVADASKYGQNAYAFIPGINDYAAKMDAASGLGARLGISAEDALQQSTGYSSSYWRAAQDAYDSLQHPTTTSIPGFAVGTSFVTQDMTARIHKGEEITPRPYVDMQRSDRERTNELLAQLVSENQSMRKTVELQQAALDKIEKSSLKTAQYAEITYGEAQA
jgi:hypothetical protein